MRIHKFNESNKFNDRIKDLGYIQDLFTSALDEFNILFDCIYYECGDTSEYYIATSGLLKGRRIKRKWIDFQGYNSDGHLTNKVEFQTKRDLIAIEGKINSSLEIGSIKEAISKISNQIKSTTNLKKSSNYYGNYSEKTQSTTFNIRFFY
jgi:hypothetical protein